MKKIMNIVFNHTRYATMDGTLLPKGGITFAMEEIEPDLFNQITEEHVLEAQFGFARCSDKDLYNKKIGREIAKGRMVNTEFEVTSINQFVDGQDRDVKIIYLTNNNGINVALVQKTGSSFIRMEADVTR
jgi:hypothetical protein